MWTRGIRLGSASVIRGVRSQSTQSPKFVKSTLGLLDDFSLTKSSNIQLSEHNSLPLHLAITKKAADKMNDIKSTEEKYKDLALRLKVSSGGCHGFQYDLELTNSKAFKPDEGDSLFERDGAKVIADKAALEILRDSKVDYVTELIGESFKVVESPFAKSSCGCGSSFDVDFDALDKAGEKPT